ITIDEFMKVDLRTGKILEAEKVKKSKKLVQLKVDIGTETRQILAGIAESFEPEDLIGRTVIIVANLKPAKLMGIESQGMLLAANNDGSLLLAGFDKEPGLGIQVR
ncbi:MAG: methionine--tRNA ligase subunit beta, partial [Nitrospinae bacterium]|nr:methionine--tRNA ligase subunit beta [Nitrospinota bacterium]